jgi:DNA-binding NarL/FixJ family response regulator
VSTTITRLRVATLLRPTTRQRWRSLAEDPGLEILGAADLPQLDRLERYGVDALLIDLRAAPRGAFDVAAHHAASRVPILLVTPPAGLVRVPRLVCDGAAGCVVTTQPPGEVAHALHAAAAGALVAPKDAIVSLVMVIVDRDAPPPRVR